jgi:hypothetical protein
MTELEEELKEDIDLCPFLRSCTPTPDNNTMEDYCIFNDYESCAKYVEYKKKRGEKE